MRFVIRLIDCYLLAVRYWIEGETWTDARWLAGRIVFGFRRKP